MGEEFLANPKPTKETVAVWRTKYDVLEAIEKTVQLIGGIDVKGSKILLLPTLLSPKHPYFSENTSPQFLEATIKYLVRLGADNKNIKVASQSFTDIPIEASAQKSQLLMACNKNNINPLDLSKTNFVKKENEGISFEISEEVFNNDLIINLPMLKISPEMKVKGPAENVLTFLKKESYLSLKYLHQYEDLLLKVKRVLPEYLTIGEAVSIQKSNQITAFLGLILASFNPFNLERVFS